MRITTRDIAKEAGVSQTTVSLVLNNSTKVSISSETRAHVIKVAERMGYQFKKRVVQNDGSPLVGVLIPTLSNLYYPLLVHNIEQYARSLGVTTVTQNTMRSIDGEVQSIRYLRSIGVQGLLCLFTPKCSLPEDIPAVIIGEKLDGTSVDTVSLNSFAAGRIAADHMISLGHQHIAYISTPLSNVTDARRKRLEGIQDSMSALGLLDNLKVYIDKQESEISSSTYEFNCGMRLTEQLLQENSKCTAIIAVNDMTAMGCISALNKHGIKIPTEMAVCGLRLSARTPGPVCRCCV